jgi:hypothetical protein
MLSNFAINSIMKTLDWCDWPKNVALAMFPIPEIPSSRWGMLNRFIMAASGTYDARGALQWRQVHRFIIKGAKPLFIVCPQTSKQEGENGESMVINKGFVSVPVYGYQWTYGDPVIEHKPIGFPKLSMDKLCERWKLRYYLLERKYQVNTIMQESEWQPAGEEDKDFAWNLVKNVYYELHPDHYSRIDKPIVMEIASLAFLYMIGMKVIYTGRHFEKIQRFGEKMKLSTMASCFTVGKLIEQVLKNILDIGIIQDEAQIQS